MTTPRWFTDTSPGHSARYIERFRGMAARGDDLAGEARFVDALVTRGARILDAGCGPGRVAAELHARGHLVVGADVDPELIEAARVDHPGPTYLVADLCELEPPPVLFDAAVLAGNVLLFVAAEHEGLALQRVAASVRPDGVVVAGFATGRGYAVEQFGTDSAAAGLVLEHRFATWDLRPWRDDADWVVTVLRKPATDTGATG